MVGARARSGSARQLASTLRRWLSQAENPRKAIEALPGYLRFIEDWRTYRSMPGAEAVAMIDTYPQVHDRTTATEVDRHYFYINTWAMRLIVDQLPKVHVDVGSQIPFVSLLSTLLPVAFLEYRPPDAPLRGLSPLRGDILRMPFRDRSLSSVSCLHVAEHIGLGRYGDALDPLGTRKAAAELSRVLAVGGNLYFALPVGVPRVAFNAHRIHSASAILGYFPDLALVSFAGVGDDGTYNPSAPLTDFDRDQYACGMFWFRRE